MQADGGRRRGPYSVDAALDDYLLQTGQRDIANTRRRLDAFIRPAIGKLDCAKLTAQRLEKLQRDIAASPARLRSGADKANSRAVDKGDDEAVRKRRASANRIMTSLKAALNLGFRDGRIASDAAWRRVKPFAKVDEPRRRYLSEDEALRLVNASQGDFRALAMGALLTGARYQELARLRVRDFDRAAETLFIERTKAGPGRPVWLDGEGVQLVEAQSVGKQSNDLIFDRAGRQWRASEQARPLHAAIKAARMEDCTFHDLRRTYGARLALKGVPMAVIAQALGHADTRITERHYAHLQSGFVADSIRAAVAGMGLMPAQPGRKVMGIETARRKAE